MWPIEQLEGYLWSAADILRGSIDSSDYKNYIFGLLFLKRLSDRFEEECEALEAEGYDPDDPDEHQFFVPERARWSHVRRATMNIGEVLNMAASALEETNPSLEGVLAGTDYNDERKLGDTRQRDSTLHRLPGPTRGHAHYGTGIPAAILVINRGKPDERKGKVLFVEASREFREGGNQNYLQNKDINKITAAVHVDVRAP